MAGFWDGIRRALGIGQPGEYPNADVTEFATRSVEEVIELVGELGPERVREQLKALVRPAVAFDTVRIEGAPQIGASRLGGLPDLPDGAEWPRWKKGPLSFIAQIRLSEVAPHDSERLLPDSGMLYFFYDASAQPWGFEPPDAEASRAVFVGDEARARCTAAMPADLDARTGAFSPCSVTWKTIGTLPSLESMHLLGPLELSADEEEVYLDLREAVGVCSEAEQSWMLGYADNIQGDMYVEAERYCPDPGNQADPRSRALSAGASEWQLLLQVMSDPNANMMWGDAGMIYFWVLRSDLAARDFTRTWSILQCY